MRGGLNPGECRAFPAGKPECPFIKHSAATVRPAESVRTLQRSLREYELL